MDYNRKIINLTIDLAINNVETRNGGPFGAIIIKDNEIISKGVNIVTACNDPTAHAEIVAIREACKKLDTPFLTDCVLYSSCEPCPMCYSAIRWSKIDKIYYSNTRKEAKLIGFDDDKIYYEIMENKQNMVQVYSNKANLPFLKWQEDKKKKTY